MRRCTEAQVRKDKGEGCWCWRAGFSGMVDGIRGWMIGMCFGFEASKLWKEYRISFMVDWIAWRRAWGR